MRLEFAAFLERKQSMNEFLAGKNDNKNKNETLGRTWNVLSIKNNR